MKDELCQSLDRTLLLMRDELHEGVSDEILIDALTETEVVLAGDVENLSSHAAQCAYVTGALLMARSGHRVVLSAPDVPLVGPQPPLRPGDLVTSLMEVGADLLPGVEFSLETARLKPDLCVTFGDTRAATVPANRTISVNASAWSAHLQSRRGERWHERRWPYGAMAAGALAAGEAFKASMHKLRHFVRAADNFDEFLAFSDEVRFDLAPPDAQRPIELGTFDLVSGGAIANTLLYCLGRISHVTGAGRVIDDTLSDLSNLNRYQLLRRSRVLCSKVDTLCETNLGGSRYSRCELGITRAQRRRWDPCRSTFWLAWITFPLAGLCSRRSRIGWESVQRLTGTQWPRFTGPGFRVHGVLIPETTTLIPRYRRSLSSRSGQACCLRARFSVVQLGLRCRSTSNTLF